MKYRRYRSDKMGTGKSSPDRLKGSKVPEGFVLEVTHFAGGVSANEQRLTELGYVTVTGEDQHLKYSKETETKTFELKGEVWLVAGEYPYVECINMDAGNEYFLSVHGKLYPVDNEGFINAKVLEVDKVPD